VEPRWRPQAQLQLQALHRLPLPMALSIAPSVAWKNSLSQQQNAEKHYISK
jgi:hypothetical protein